VPAKRGLLAFVVLAPRRRVYVCFIAIFKLPFKFARHHRLQQAGKRLGQEDLGKKTRGRVEQRTIPEGIMQIRVGREPRSGDEAA
jgi:hypothetical protein